MMLLVTIFLLICMAGMWRALEHIGECETLEEEAAPLAVLIFWCASGFTVAVIFL